MVRLVINLTKLVAGLSLGLAAILILILTGLWLLVARDLPNPRDILARPLSNCADGTVAQPADVAKLPEHVREAFIAAEQPDFWTSRATPTMRVFLLIFHRPATGRGAELSAQLASNQIAEAFPGKGRTLISHFRVIVQADRIEFYLTKDEILSRVLDWACYGNKIASLGCATAFYFAKQPQSLDVGEAALLAGLLKSPNNYNPGRNPDRAIERRAQVLDGMVAAGVISADMAHTANASASPAFKTGKQN